MPFLVMPAIDIFVGKVLSVLLSLMLTFGVVSVEKRGADATPADPDAPYLFDSCEEYRDYIIPLNMTKRRINGSRRMRRASKRSRRTASR